MTHAPRNELRTGRAPAVRRSVALWTALTIGAFGFPAAKTPSATSTGYVLNDAHFHLTNYVQEGTDIRAFLEIVEDSAFPPQAPRRMGPG